MRSVIVRIEMDVEYPNGAPMNEVINAIGNFLLEREQLLPLRIGYLHDGKVLLLRHIRTVENVDTLPTVRREIGRWLW